MYQSFQKPLSRKVASSSSAGNDASVDLSPSICIKGRNVDVDKFLEFVVAIAQDRHGWSESNILFKDVEDFAKKHHIHLRNKTKCEQNRFNVRGLTENIRELIIPKLRELYPEKMQDLLKESGKNSSDRSLGSKKQVKKVSPELFNQRHIKILERVLKGESDLSPRDEKTLTSFGIDVNILRFNGENSQSYQEQMIRVRQKLAFLKLKFHT
jgi:hypothetical protein